MAEPEFELRSVRPDSTGSQTSCYSIRHRGHSKQEGSMVSIFREAWCGGTQTGSQLSDTVEMTVLRESPRLRHLISQGDAHWAHVTLQTRRLDLTSWRSLLWSKAAVTRLPQQCAQRETCGRNDSTGYFACGCKHHLDWYFPTVFQHLMGWIVKHVSQVE